MGKAARESLRPVQPSAATAPIEPTTGNISGTSKVQTRA